MAERILAGLMSAMPPVSERWWLSCQDRPVLQWFLAHPLPRHCLGEAVGKHWAVSRETTCSHGYVAEVRMGSSLPPSKAHAAFEIRPAHAGSRIQAGVWVLSRGKPLQRALKPFDGINGSTSCPVLTPTRACPSLAPSDRSGLTTHVVVDRGGAATGDRRVRCCGPSHRRTWCCPWHQ